MPSATSGTVWDYFTENKVAIAPVSEDEENAFFAKACFVTGLERIWAGNRFGHLAYLADHRSLPRPPIRLQNDHEEVVRRLEMAVDAGDVLNVAEQLALSSPTSLSRETPFHRIVRKVSDDTAVVGISGFV